MTTRHWKVAIAGEALVSRSFSMHDEPAFLEIIKLLREADVTYAHLEQNLADVEEIAKGDTTTGSMLGDPKVADDLKWAGVDIVSNAFNHGGAFGVSGFLATRRHCKRAGLACAGIGGDLEEARAPGYLETKKGRVALVSMSTGHPDQDCATLPKSGFPGRPGANPLRISTKLVVDHQTAEQLKEVGKKLQILITKTKSPASLGFEEGEFGWGGGGAVIYNLTNSFVEGDRFEVRLTLHQKDLERNRRSVDEAMQMADLVLVAHHCSVSEGPRGDDPPKFVRVVAKECIDAGADIYLGHGWHKTLGIEIYKNKPIFYGLGNFFSRSWSPNIPYSAYEHYGLDMDRLPSLNCVGSPKFMGLLPDQKETWWSSAITVIEMEGHEMTGMKLYPIELGRDASPEMTLRRRTGSGSSLLTEGIPWMADKKNGQRILERIQRLSAEFGTKIEINDGVGDLKF